ncbi:MAG: hypothetical protein WC648_05230 [Candidatus Paceibacterota bacterium]
MNQRRIPAKLESLRKEFNNVETLRSEAEKQAGIVITNDREQSQSKSVIPVRRRRQKRTGRVNKSDISKARRNRRSRDTKDNGKGGARFGNKNQDTGNTQGTAAINGNEKTGSEAHAEGISQVGTGISPGATT